MVRPAIVALFASASPWCVLALAACKAQSGSDEDETCASSMMQAGMFKVREFKAADPDTSLVVLESHRSKLAVHKPHVVTVFSAECTPYHDWQSVVLYHSWREANIPGSLIRLLACDAKEQLTYSRLDGLGEALITHVHDNMKDEVPGGYPPLNKPYGISHWLAHGSGRHLPDDTVILIIDPDMTFAAADVAKRLVPVISRVQSGEIGGIGNDYQYTVSGMRAEGWAVPRHFNASLAPESLQSIGPPMMLRKDNLAKLATGWHDVTLEIALDPSLKALVSDGKQKNPWIAEMYGYTIAAAGWLWHETQQKWPVLTAPQPPFLDGKEEAPFIHYSHNFSLCGRTFGKSHFFSVDLLNCSVAAAHLLELEPPAHSEVTADACKLCLQSGDVIGFSANCLETSATQKSIARRAMSTVFDAIFAFEASHCSLQEHIPEHM